MKAFLFWLGVAAVSTSFTVWSIKTTGSVLIIAPVTIPLFLFVSLLVFVKLLSNKPGWIVSKTGLINHSIGSAAKEVRWSDVTHITFCENRFLKFVCLHVSNPKQFINRQKNPFTKIALKYAFKMFGTPIRIITIGLDVTIGQLLNILNAYY